MIDLKGHAALVTGSTRGSGSAIALACAQAGADMLIHGRSMSDDAQQAIDACRACGVASGFVAADLSGPTQSAVTKLCDQARGAMPHIDILINNAGQLFDLPFMDMTFDRYEKTMRLNVASGYFLTQLYAQHWIAQQIAGRVLFVGSVNGRLAEPDSTAYDISKGAIEMMVKTLCVALAPHQIRVNGMAPGLVRTQQTDCFDKQPELAQWMTLHTPNGQIPDAQVCGPASVYLVVDGGISAWQQPQIPTTSDAQ
jgi:glucose 1-dehydrogenase